MRRQLWLRVGILGAVVLCTGAWLGVAPAVDGRAGAGLGGWFSRGGEPPVLVLLVADRAGLEGVKHSVSPNRILAATPDAFVLREGRVIAVRPEAVGAPLTELGWVERPIEIWSARKSDPHEPGRSDADGDDESTAEARPGELAELARQETLSIPEAVRALALLDGA